MAPLVCDTVSSYPGHYFRQKSYFFLEMYQNFLKLTLRKKRLPLFFSKCISKSIALSRTFCVACAAQSRRAEVSAGGRFGMPGRCGNASAAPMRRMRRPRGMRMRGQYVDAACVVNATMQQQPWGGFNSYGPASERPADRFLNCFNIGLRRRRRRLGGKHMSGHEQTMVPSSQND